MNFFLSWVTVSKDKFDEEDVDGRIPPGRFGEKRM